MANRSHTVSTGDDAVFMLFPNISHTLVGDKITIFYLRFSLLRRHGLET